MVVVSGKGPCHTPFETGLPSNRSTMAKGGSLLQTVIVFEMPALALPLTEMFTVAVRVVQGGTPATE
jgi:hypothetical protein